MRRETDPLNAHNQRIVMASPIRPDAREGGAAHQRALYECFTRLGAEVVLLAPGPAQTTATSSCVFTPSTRDWGLPAACDALWQIPMIAWLRVTRRMRTLYVRAGLFAVAQVLCARLLGMHVIVEHNSWNSREREARGGGRWGNHLERWAQVAAARLAQRSRCVTPGIARLLEAAGCPPARLIVIGNGTDLANNAPLPSAPPVDGRIRLGFIGLLTVWQGLTTAIEALALLRDEDRFVLTIAGDGPERAALERQVEALGLGAAVRFMGHVPQAETAGVIAACDIAIAPYTRARNEEIGLSAIKIRDYAACGRPVVAARLPGIEELEDAGWLFTHRPDDAADLVRVLTEVAALPAAARAAAGEAARAYAERHFDWSAIAARILSDCGEDGR